MVLAEGLSDAGKKMYNYIGVSKSVNSINNVMVLAHGVMVLADSVLVLADGVMVLVVMVGRSA